MVAQTKETMTQLFDTFAEATRASFDVGRRVQEQWFGNVDSAVSSRARFEEFAGQAEKASKEWFSLIGKNLRTFGEAFNGCFDANQKAFEATCDMTAKAGEGDFSRRSRNTCDATFGAFQANVDAFQKATQQTMNNWSSFCSAGCCEPRSSKTSSKSDKS